MRGTVVPNPVALHVQHVTPATTEQKILYKRIAFVKVTRQS